MRRLAVLRRDAIDKGLFRKKGNPLGPRHITTGHALGLFLARVRETLDPLGHARHLSMLHKADHDEIFDCEAYVLPPQYLTLTLRMGYLVINNREDATQPRRFVPMSFDGRGIGVHRIGLGLHMHRHDHLFLSTLEPDTRTASTVVIGVPAAVLGNGLGLKNTIAAPPPQLLDPLQLLKDYSGTAPPPIATSEAPVLHDAYVQ